MTFRTALTAVFAGLALSHIAAGADWITAPSYYSHDPATGERVTQYSPIGPFYTFARPDYQRSGYRNTRSSLQVGDSADNLHVVEEWGRPIRPYGEWRFPYRPYSVPYAGWGAPFAGLNQPGFYPYPSTYSPYSQADGAQPTPYDRQQPPPYYDGSYPRYRTRTPVPWGSRRSPRSRHGGPGYGGGGPGGPSGPGHGGPGHGGPGHGPGGPGHGGGGSA